MTKPPLSHYSPRFANRPWANEKSELLCYYKDVHRGDVQKKPEGAKQWGRQRGLYTWKVERALTEDLENAVAPIYAGFCEYREPDASGRRIWAQHLMSQLIRTPTFMRYEKAIRRKLNITEEPVHDRVGCEHCMDLACVTSRDWAVLQAHPDDHFVRGDNPVFLTGFIERPETSLYYPISPRLCFVACSMGEDWIPRYPEGTPPIRGYRLHKGGAHMINFYLARSAEESLVLSSEDDGNIAETMFGDVLGVYPQPPFPLHTPRPDEMPQAYTSIRKSMSFTDQIDYPDWRPGELEPFRGSASSTRTVPSSA